MKKIFIYIMVSLSVGVAVTSCSKDEDVDLSAPILGLGGDKWVKNDIDKWLDTAFVNPYNIEVKYRWDPFEVNVNKTLVPVLEEMVVPVMSMVKTTWIEPYNKVIDPAFIKKYCPKQFQLVGSAEWNTNNTITLGTAEGGRKIVLFRINSYDETDREQIEQMLHTIQHEFAHILHQNKEFSTEYRNITPTGYSANWQLDTNPTKALNEGFVTPYSRSNEFEDFVEMVSTMLVMGKPRYDTMIDGITNATGKANLRKKEQMVVDYFKNSWAIDFYQLQTEVQLGIQKVMTR
ncbi:zinc-binding metallopeptidase [Arcticibacter tournemirensis]|uniref:Substrate import-associated zinc metallohydrolase lipoprotein n=1 Tax=Arcticibacter tournemirensis TaxID=699437 RepID=A0A4Q0M7K9_9SPHI|nr:putative zinc-binding metallopeptidase [Arcticibacter tournemirensis]RXF68706.1 hypothetical protein EKH83_15380 [Arcticibacter tournemirensis]